MMRGMTRASGRTGSHLPFALLLVLAVSLGVAPRAGAVVFDPARVACRTMDNGLRVVVKEGHSAPIVAVDVYVHFGSGDEDETTNGVAHAIEHMIFQGRDEARVGRLPRMIEGLGGRVLASTTRDHTHFAVAVSSEYFEQAVTQLAMALGHPELEADTVQRELAIIAHELRQMQEDPLFVLREQTFALSFVKHGYRLPVGGTEESIAALDRTVLERTHRAYYTAPNMTVVVVGDVDPELAFRVVGEAFSQFDPAPPPVRTPVDEPRRMTRKEAPPIEIPGARTLMVLGFPSPGLAGQKQDVCAMDVLMTVLGDGAHSRFQRRVIEEKKAAEMVSAMYLTQRDPGVFYVWAAAPTGGLEAAANAILAEVADVRANGITPEELARAKAIVTGSYATQSETYVDQAATLGFYDSIDSYQFAVDYEGLVNAVTAEDVQRVALAYLDIDKYTLVSIVPAAQP